MTLAKKLRDVKTGSTESRGGVASIRLDRVPESWIGVPPLPKRSRFGF